MPISYKPLCPVSSAKRMLWLSVALPAFAVVQPAIAQELPLAGDFAQEMNSPSGARLSPTYSEVGGAISVPVPRASMNAAAAAELGAAAEIQARLPANLTLGPGATSRISADAAGQSRERGAAPVAAPARFVTLYPVNYDQIPLSKGSDYHGDRRRGRQAAAHARAQPADRGGRDHADGDARGGGDGRPRRRRRGLRRRRAAGRRATARGLGRSRPQGASGLGHRHGRRLADRARLAPLLGGGGGRADGAELGVADLPRAPRAGVGDALDRERARRHGQPGAAGPRGGPRRPGRRDEHDRLRRALRLRRREPARQI